MRRLSARLSDEACDGWDQRATDLGVTVAALLEAIGLDLSEDVWEQPFEEATVIRAREIQRARKKRR